MKIHNSAIVSKKSKIDKDACIGPYSIVTDNVSIGAGTIVGAHCVIDGNTVIGKNCQIFTGAVIGSQPQDLKYKGERSFLEIGDGNIIREYCTFNPGTGEGGRTIVGSSNLFMAYSHVAHDCLVGNGCVIANNGTLAGHVTIEDKAVIGGIVAIHQFVRVGKLSIIGGCSKVVQDVPPFSTCEGHPTLVYGLNLIGLRRQNVSKESIKQMEQLDQAFRLMFNSGMSIKHSIIEIKKQFLKPVDEVAYLLEFAQKSERGLSRSCRAKSQ
ncbi:MAG: acyl-ACP--UDP-N-acetylglucosamine O-acyltransferase [Candidatus Omnitrophica bacterium]|nr:acyl-ACP--UDP-N-acetylglucosamine O-acyltransferase [Candidatus Omnitrophota bacterium]